MEGKNRIVCCRKNNSAKRQAKKNGRNGGKETGSHKPIPSLKPKVPIAKISGAVNLWIGIELMLLSCMLIRIVDVQTHSHIHSLTISPISPNIFPSAAIRETIPLPLVSATRMWLQFYLLIFFLHLFRLYAFSEIETHTHREREKHTGERTSRISNILNVYS